MTSFKCFKSAETSRNDYNHTLGISEAVRFAERTQLDRFMFTADSNTFINSGKSYALQKQNQQYVGLSWPTHSFNQISLFDKLK